MAVNPQISANVHYDPFEDFTPVGPIAFSPLVLVTHPSVQAKTLPDLIAYTKAHPGTLNWGTPRLGTISDLSLSYLNLHGGLAVEHVP
jgi:tripartite-type tricarboxylate transporter receptor subunit TctC